MGAGFSLLGPGLECWAAFAAESREGAFDVAAPDCAEPSISKTQRRAVFIFANSGGSGELGLFDIAQTDPMRARYGAISTLGDPP